MALIKCPECGKEISDKAIKCPKCGCHISNEKTIKKPKSKILIASFIVLLLVIISFAIFWNVTKDERMIKNDKTPPKFTNIPEKITTMVGESIVFDDYLKENNVTVSDEVTKDIIYTIDDSTIDFNTPGSYQLSISATDEAKNTTKETIDITVNDYPTHIAFMQATNLTFDQLSPSGTAYSFDDIHIPKEEANHIEDGTMYRSIAKQIEGYFALGAEFYGNWGNDIVPLIFTEQKAEKWEDYYSYVHKMALLITRKVNVGAIMSILDSLNTVDGTFDYNNGVFAVQIPDLTETANELEITERMLGYILAMLQEYGTESTFDKNSYSCNLTFVGKREIDITDYISYENWDNEIEQYSLIEDNGYRYYCAYFDDDSGEGEQRENINGIYTNRYLQLGHSLNAVIFSHNGGEIRDFKKDNDILYKNMVAQNDYNYTTLDHCTKYIVYNVDNAGNIVYYFNDADELLLVMYSNVVAY